MIKVLVLFILTFSAFAQDFLVKDLTINCGDTIECTMIKEEFQSLARTYSSMEHMQKILKTYLISEGIKNFRYELWQNNEEYNLVLNFVPKRIATDVNVKIKPPEELERASLTHKLANGVKAIVKPFEYDVELPTILPLQEGDYIDDNKIQKTIELLENVFTSKGFPDIEVRSTQKLDSDRAFVTFHCYPGRPIQVTEINVESKNLFLKDILIKRLSSFSEGPFKIQKIKDVIDENHLLFKDFGHYMNEIQFRYKRISKYKVNLFIEIFDNGLHVFNLKGNKDISQKELKDELSFNVATYKKVLNIENVKQIIEKKYLEYGFVHTKIDVKKQVYKDIKGVLNNRYDINIDEGKRSLLKKLHFRGNNFFRAEELEKLFEDNAFDLASEGVYDSKFYNAFVTTLKEAYLAKGFVNVFIEDPFVKISKDGNVDLEYRIREGSRTKVNKLTFSGVPANLVSVMMPMLQNKQGSYFNPLIFDQDLETIINYLNEQGYYFAKIKNAMSPSLVSYNDDVTEVNLLVDIDLDKRLYLNKIIIIGNRKTSSKLIGRQLTLREGDLLTKEDVRNSQTNLLSLGLFSSINLTPIGSENQSADLLISIQEKDFGLIEIAPGIRTDLGVKVSGAMTYLNLDGMNKQLSLQWQVNNRFDFRTLDERRRDESRHLLEYQASLGFNENNIFDSGMDFGSTLSTMRRRFFSFDADIQRINATFSKDWSSWFGTSFQLQIESISQFDATEEQDHGVFQIGSFTPSVTFDFRDNRINPLSGSFFNLSTEFANPTFLSQENDELVINYYKIVSRNRFYIPMKNGVLAISLAAGMQKNLATDKKISNSGDQTTEGYIPDIKVFRLTGIDIVRGFEDDEINRLISGEDISEYRVNDTAYMVNFKFEPRYFINDSMMLGLFYDAGRVFVNSYDLEQLRSSAGLTFKYLTPVGSIDFDYGIKLLRKRDVDGILDSPGRLHVSIGFF